jgi:hypothetical protein
MYFTVNWQNRSDEHSCPSEGTITQFAWKCGIKQLRNLFNKADKMYPSLGLALP